MKRQHTLQFLSPNDWTLLSLKAERRRFRLGEEIICAGSQVRHPFFVFVRSGSATVELPNARSTTEIALLAEGDTRGEMAALGDGIATATVIAKDMKVEADAIHIADLRLVCHEIPSFGSRMFQSLAANLAMLLKDISAELMRAQNNSRINAVSTTHARFAERRI